MPATESESSHNGGSSSKPPPRNDGNELDSMRRVADLIKSGKAKNVILLLGAGISTSAGIPDFRSPQTGLYHNLQKLNLPFPEAVFELGFFRKNPQPFWILAKELYPGKHFPTPTHYFLKLLESQKVLRRVFTQNIDTLETLAGLDPDKIVEAHGSFAKSHCLDCKREVDREEVLRSGVRRGEVVRCNGSNGSRDKGKKKCGGLVKPDIVFFGEDLPDRFFRLIPELKTCDLLIVIGTSLQVQPFASLVNHVPPTCPRLLINREPVGPFSSLTSSRSMPGGFLSDLNKILDSNKKQSAKMSRDMYWEGDADDGVWRLAEKLGWSGELEEVIEKGKKDLERKYREAEKVEAGDETETPPAKPEEERASAADVITKESKVVDEDGGDAAERAKNGAAAVEPVVGSKDDAEEKSEADELEQAIRQQLKL
ncbi:NAD-dependent histone deacetylase SIR2 [Kwoniella heveanensis BCC8398]|uniref:NAD-dependent protein deacetylase n=1 Tax=Kwoniella heveanensis BCC8398 TaxID=1296120 RepID=A0A1B9GIX4_9TREE|nr:NAD-dependent histone deacetylase SIR2 [Kwoniella heveanensis BCC8398]